MESAQLGRYAARDLRSRQEQATKAPQVAQLGRDAPGQRVALKIKVLEPEQGTQLARYLAGQAIALQIQELETAQRPQFGRNRADDPIVGQVQILQTLQESQCFRQPAAKTPTGEVDARDVAALELHTRPGNPVPVVVPIQLSGRPGKVARDVKQHCVVPLRQHEPASGLGEALLFRLALSILACLLGATFLFGQSRLFRQPFLFGQSLLLGQPSTFRLLGLAALFGQARFFRESGLLGQPLLFGQSLRLKTLRLETLCLQPLLLHLALELAKLLVRQPSRFGHALLLGLAAFFGQPLCLGFVLGLQARLLGGFLHGPSGREQLRKTLAVQVARLVDSTRRLPLPQPRACIGLQNPVRLANGTCAHPWRG